MSLDEIEHIHMASLSILEETGMDFLEEEAQSLLKEGGADVRSGSDRVRFDRDLIMDLISSVPREFILHARNPAHNVLIKAGYMAFASVGSPPNVSDIDSGRRPGNSADYKNFIRLSQYFNSIHVIGGYPVEPVDRHASIRHLECLRDIVILTDKVFHAYSLGKERICDGLEIARIARGNISWSQFEDEPSVLSVINTSSPLRLDTPMLRGIIEMSRRKQPLVITPFTLSGAMAPVTLAGALAQQNAEALAGIAFSQIVRRGAPVIYGGFTSNVDMKSGAPAFGTPEYMQTVIAGGQLARRYGFPYRTSNVNAANSVDAQSAYESVFSLWAVCSGHGNLIKHAAGWLEGGLTASYEKFILDIDLLQMVCAFMRPFSVNDQTLALDAIADVGPGGHFFGTEHTQARYRDAFYAPLISDWRNYESWEEGGSPVAYQRANSLWKHALEDYHTPTLDESVKDALNDFVDRRISEGGAPTDF